MKGVFLAAILVMFLLAGSAIAYPTYPTVNLSLEGVSPVAYGSFHWPHLSYSGLVDVGSYNLLINGKTYSGFCVEDVWAPSGTMTYDVVPPSVLDKMLGGTVPRYQQAAWLFQNYVQHYGTTDQIATIATQVAIWEVVLDPGNYNLSSGNFSVNSLDNGYKSDAQDMLNTLKNQSLNGFNADYYCSVVWSPSLVGSEPKFQYPQNYIIPDVHAPEPATIILLGLGLVALGGVRRKFKE
jgi:hypothetical protein